MKDLLRSAGSNLSVRASSVRHWVLRSSVVQTLAQKVWIRLPSEQESNAIVRIIRLTSWTGIWLIIGYLLISVAFADGTLPEPIKLGLPMEGMKSTSDNPMPQVVSIIRETIKYVGVLAILSLSWGGIQFLVSIGEDGKVKKAKSIVMYSLIGVILSITAYTIIDIVNGLSLRVQ